MKYIRVNGKLYRVDENPQKKVWMLIHSDGARIAEVFSSEAKVKRAIALTKAFRTRNHMKPPKFTYFEAPIQ